MALGSMSYGEARTCATELGNAASEMDNLFSQLKAEMNSLEEVLRSNGASELYATYKTLEAKLDGFPNNINMKGGEVDERVRSKSRGINGKR